MKLFSSLLLMTAVGMLMHPGAVFGQQGQPPPAPSDSEPLPISGVAPLGSVTTSQTTAPGASGASSNTLNGSVQIQGAFQGSVPTGTATPEPLPLTLDEAIRRGLAYNLGVVSATQIERDARAVQREALARLLPDVNGTILAAAEQVSIATLGFQSGKGVPPGFQFAPVIGPFHFFEAGAALSQRVFDLTAIRNYRSTKETAVATEHGVRDSRDLVVLAVGGSYLQAVAASASVDSAKAQLDTARAVYTQAMRQNEAGLNARIDVDRSQVEMQMQRLRLISLETDLASQKLALGRIIGLPLGQEFLLTTAMEYAPSAQTSLPDALTAAFAGRADLQAAEAQVRAAEQAWQAAKAQYIPALTVNGSYFLAGQNPTQSNGVFSVFASIDFPIWRSGRIQADVAAARAAHTQRRAEYEDVRGRVDSEVRNAFLRLTASNEQVAVADSNRNLAQKTLRQARDRFGAGVADTVEVVQAQESVAAAEQDHIASLYAHYLAKLALARATGNTEQGIATLLQPGRP